MFVLCRDPLPLSEACLLGLCASLNAPVVHGDELPPGPARAAIVTFAEEYGDFGVAVGMRALESGSVAVYRYREPLLDADDVARATEAALRFAEGLGFLFDDEMIDRESGAGRSEALEHWLRLTGGAESFTPGSVAEPPSPPIAEITLPGEGLDAPMEDLLASPEESAGDAGSASSELLLDDLMDAVEQSPDDELILMGDSADALEVDGMDEDGSDDADLELDDDPAGPAPEAPTITVDATPEPAAPLTKFRRRPPAADPPARARSAAPEPAGSPRRPAREARPEPEGAEEVGAAALGRIPIVRRRKAPAEGARAGALTRLLASF
jgi:hypothetical protein